MKKKLLFIVHSLCLGGTERLVVSLCKSLQRDYHIGIVCLDEQGVLWDECSGYGWDLYCANREPGNNLANIRKCNAILSAFQPDIVHAHQYTPFFFAALKKLTSLKKYKLIFTEHGRNYPDVISSKRRLINKCLLPQADVVTGVSQFSIESLREVEGVRGEIELIYNGVNIEESELYPLGSLRDELGIPDDVKIVGVVGSLREVKNPMFVLRAMELVKKTIDRVALVYIGDGPLREVLVEMSKQSNLSTDVFFAGPRNPATPYFHQLSAFVLASFQEAAPLAVLESMILKVPVIVSDRGGAPELIKNNETGLIVECDNDRELASAIIQVISDPAWVGSLTQAAYQDVSSRFSFNSMLNSYKKIYEKLT